MILRCWLVVWVNEPAPLSLWHCDPELCSIEKRSIERTAHFMGRPYTIESQWGQILVPSCPPRGVQLYPILRYGPYRACQPLQMWQIHILWNPLSELRGVNFFRNVKSMGQIWDAPAPQGCNFTPFEVWSYRACQPLEMWQISHFCEIHFLSYEASKFFFNVKSMRLIFAPILPLGQTSYPRSRYKSHSTRFPIRPHVLTPHSWLCDKTVGGVARRNKSGRRIIISMSNNNTVLAIKMASTIN